ncbi:uncharacterized protein J7T54_005932 [Emericellopsis cladophorae]|uniref:Uncharacterized protein n=1 Tax=Emericellopsis cladophorae TaxID=2686198 RepID=A0A9P9Y900_9HYPO|nr:uncharacterized protein J7T54_005932 [Emericellopsis cladophorae]KAI6785598.1 hypothetical protein J7T54_005932 [Emericellopsis cladophorae]
MDTRSHALVSPSACLLVFLYLTIASILLSVIDPTTQYYSEIERQRLVQQFGITPSFDTSSPRPPVRRITEPASSQPRHSKPRQSSRRSSIAEEARCSNTRRFSQVGVKGTQVYSLHAQKPGRRRTIRDETKRRTRRPRSVAPDRVDEAFLEFQSLQLREREGDMASGDHGHAQGVPQAFYDSFRWLEDDGALDLRLGLSSYHHDIQEQPRPAPKEQEPVFPRRPSFRHRLSMNKATSSRPPLPGSRPGTKETAAPSLKSVNSFGPSNGAGHVRKASRALSLMSLNKQPAPEPPAMIDPDAAHYQDPNTRMTLRHYVASPQKFDEALAYGFPSLNESNGSERKQSKDNGFGAYKLRTFFDDDQMSTHSNDSTVSDPDSPKTPPITDKPVPAHPVRVHTEPIVPTLFGVTKTIDNPREMTMRMTLTRPDLRSHDEQIYGWQQKPAPARKSHVHSDSCAPPALPRQDSRTKDMEQHFATLDREGNADSAPENGSLRRLWKRVRRS